MYWREMFPRVAPTLAILLSTLALALMPVLGTHAMTLVILVWMALMFSQFFWNDVRAPKSACAWFLLLASPFLLMLLDMPRAPDLRTGWHLVERSTALIAFPTGFLLLRAPSHPRFRDAMCDIFTLASLLLALYANGVVIFHGMLASLVPSADFSFAYRASFFTITGLHPPYAAYFFLSAALFQVVRVLDPFQRKWWRFATIIVLVVAALLVASRTPLFAFAAACIAVLFMRAKKRTAWTWSIGLVLALAIASLFVPSIAQRTHQLIETAESPAGSQPLNSVNIRMPIAHCTSALLKEHWLLGIGQANVQPALDACYQQFNIPLLLDGSYGTHCQPLHWWLCFGILGLLLFIALFALLMRRAWQQRDAAHFGSLLLILICCATENVLARQWGVVLFACFNALFVASGMHADDKA